MKVKTTETIKTFTGQEVLDDQGQTVTIKSLLVNALLAGDQKDDGMVKVSKYELAKRIYSQDNVEVSEKDIVMLKEIVGKMYGPLVIGQVYEALKI
jgi:hypothetical protein